MSKVVGMNLMHPTLEQLRQAQLNYPEYREEFFTLCMLRFGLSPPLTTCNRGDFWRFREEVYPDYNTNAKVPCMTFEDFHEWCTEKKEELTSKNQP